MIAITLSRMRALRKTKTMMAIVVADTNMSTDFSNTAKIASAALPNIVTSILLSISLS
jgi:hypothetical protein